MARYRATWPLTEVDGIPLVLSLRETGLRGAMRTALDAGESVEAIFRVHGIGY
ncbi:hypothetical protein PU630_17035 [Microbacterium horticulturae]|uniref:Uncharacterized protein n=1 Tax=Microbacterium horticulturae TaxID=3028316 RepID=A0ABY8BYH0_9MICO|nr:hypothetical protein [Microbacterium sp. KACC 23027]WEG08922.1 hypothetical protein PU630_17035 [Microbacterium sp. KACC 23027]